MIYCLPSASFESNAYIIASDRVAVVDPGIDPSRVLGELRRNNLHLDYVINTHCHFDHAAADKKLVDETTAKVCACEPDATAIEEADDELVLSSFFGEPFEAVGVDVRLSEGSVIDLGGIRLEVFHTPGHSRGSVCLLERSSKILFSGDTLFADGVGRTDFKGGSMEELKSSVARISAMASDGLFKFLYPGHGRAGSGEDALLVEKMFFGGE